MTIITTLGEEHQLYNMWFNMLLVIYLHYLRVSECNPAIQSIKVLQLAINERLAKIWF